MTDIRITIAITDRQVWLACYQHRRRRWERTALAHVKAEVRPCLQPAEDLAGLAQRIIELVRQQTPSVVLARLVIPGTWIYCHGLAGAGTKKKALAYDMEPHLPYALEDLAVTFTGGSRDPLGVAILAGPMSGLLKTLESAGILVERLGIDGIEAAEPSDAVGIWLDDQHATIVQQSQSNPHHLEVLRYPPEVAEPALLEWLRRCQWQAGQPDKPFQIVLRGQATASVGPALRQAGIQVLADPEPAEVAPLPLLTPQAANRLNLRCGPLTFSGRYRPLRKILVQCLVLLCALNVLLAVSWNLQARHNNQAVTQIQQSEQALWKQVFAGRPAPLAGIGLYVASERVRLEALTGNTDNKALARPDLLGVLRQVALALPKEARILAQDLQVNAQQLVIRGQTRTHTEAEQINRTIGTATGLQVQPASSEARPDGTVDFTVRATYASQDR